MHTMEKVWLQITWLLVKVGYDFECYYSRFLLNLFGLWPDPFHESNFMSYIQILIIIIVMFFFSTFTQTAKMIESLKNLNIVIESLAACNIPVTIAIVKLLNICYNKHVLKNLLNQSWHDWHTPHSNDELSIMWQHARISRLFSIGSIILNEASFTTKTISFLVPLIGSYKSANSNDTERPFYVHHWFPYDTQTSPSYEITQFFLVLSTLFGSLSFSASDSFFIVLVFHLISQLAILKVALLELPKNYDTLMDGNNIFKNKIFKIFKMHNRLCRFAEKLDESFSIMFLVQIVPCMFVLCTQGYTLIMMTGSEKIPILDLIFMMYFLILFLLTLFSYCYVGEKLKQKSLEVSDAAYNCNWTILPAKEARLLIIIISRGQKPFKISAGKFTIFSLQLYSTIIKTSAGYLSMLLAVRDRQTD